jgi:uncharacterized protein
VTREQRSARGDRIDVARRALLDTGFVVAVVNKADPDHERCVAAWRDVRAQLLSVDGVLVEAAHVLRRVPGGTEAAAGLVFDAGTEIVPSSAERVKRAIVLMRKYADVPMDLVDALLVVVAEEFRVHDVLTLDRRGFGVYRVGRQRFRVIP